MVSAVAAALCRASAAHAWLGFLALMPLFASIATLRPRHAFLAGAYWGTSLQAVLLLLTRETTALSPALPFVIVGAPALYMCAGAWLTRRIGYSPFVLGAGWLLVELAFLPLGLRDGLLAVSRSDAWLVQASAQGLGFVVVAFLGAYINALLASSVAAIVSRSGVARCIRGVRRAGECLHAAVRFPPVVAAFLSSLGARGPPTLLLRPRWINRAAGAWPWYCARGPLVS